MKKSVRKKKKLKGKTNFDKRMAVVSVTASCGMTLKIGEYEFMRIDASTTINASEKGNMNHKYKEKLTAAMFKKVWDLSGAEINKQYIIIDKQRNKKK